MSGRSRTREGTRADGGEQSAGGQERVRTGEWSADGGERVDGVRIDINVSIRTYSVNNPSIRMP